jgi:hypothetical protein
VEDYETQAGNVKYAHNLDIFKRINALLDNTLDLSSLTGMPIPQDQQKRKILFVTSLRLSIAKNVVGVLFPAKPAKFNHIPKIYSDIHPIL